MLDYQQLHTVVLNKFVYFSRFRSSFCDNCEDFTL